MNAKALLLLQQRHAGILLHLTSLPGPFANGVLGEEAHQFVDDLAHGGFRVWQFLPLGPTHGHGSPYEAMSSFAGNPKLIDLRECVNRGWLSEHSCVQVEHGELALNEALSEAATAFWQQLEQDQELAGAVHGFVEQQRDWLPGFALFAALKEEFNDAPWWEWPQGLRDRETAAVKKAQKQHAEAVRKVVFEQFLFARQWQALKSHAEHRGITLFGDLPIYTAHDSADVWLDRQYFTINAEGLCDEVAGVPPDYFSETGQRWGNPLYRWDVLAADGFAWWIKRVKVQMQRMHVMRIDHFRGLESFWAIPGEMQDGRIGEWRPAPGAALLQAIRDQLGELPLIAEDLGLITEEVIRLRDDFGLAGMKILQFAFGGDASNPYLPHQHIANSVAYTGTHDNDTTMGWYTQAEEHVRAHLHAYLGCHEDSMPEAMIRAMLASTANLAILPVQDILGLGAEARFNTPGTLENNWCWRLEQLPVAQVWDHMRGMNELYGRH